MGRRRLRHDVPRALVDHRAASGRVYAALYRALADRWGPFDGVARVNARELALLTLEAQDLARDQARERERGRRTVALRLGRRRLAILRAAATIQDQLERSADPHRQPSAEPW